MQLSKLNPINKGYGFQLPVIHPVIPSGYITHSTTSNCDIALANTLYEIGVIDPDRIEYSRTPVDLVRNGIHSWLEDRIGSFQRLAFHCSLENSSDVNDFFSSSDSGLEIDFPPGLIFCINADDYYGSRIYENKAKLLREAYPGLFSTAMEDIAKASNATLEILCSTDLINNFCFQFYGMDCSEALLKENARTLLRELKERFSKIPSEFLPANALPLFGMNFEPLPKKPFSVPKLQNISTSRTDRLVKDVAMSIVDLRKSLSVATKNKALFRDMGFDKTPPSVFKACNLLYSVESVVTDIIDSDINDCYNSGENCQYLTVAAFPSEKKSLKDFLFKLDLSFDVLRKLDRLIELISE